jgi:hypothetical protein
MPAQVCYQAALSAARLAAPDAAFVGRDASQLQGAKLQGMTTIAFNAGADVHADVYLQRFEDLTGLTRFSPVRFAA